LTVVLPIKLYAGTTHASTFYGLEANLNQNIKRLKICYKNKSGYASDIQNINHRYGTIENIRHNQGGQEGMWEL
jgi:hypothetical protein